MAYTIKGLAKANECETHDASGLADVWAYWLECNSNDKQSINDFKRLRKEERLSMLHYIKHCTTYEKLYDHIVEHIY